MSQQSRFSDLEQVNDEGRHINTDPREHMEAQDELPDPRPFQLMEGQKIYPPSSHKRYRKLWACILGLAALALLVSAVCFAKSIVGGARPLSLSGRSHLVSGQSNVLLQRTFTVQGMPTLIVSNPSGAVTIHRGASTSVIISAVQHGGRIGNPDDADIKMEARGFYNPEIVVATGEHDSTESVDLDITLPETSNIQARVAAGSMDINGISGQMDAKVEQGTLNFENGKIAGESSFKNDDGTLNFHGAIAAGGDYEFHGEEGVINVTLPSDSSFSLDAFSKLGKVNNDFGSNTVGSDPTSQVHIHSDADVVNIHKG